MSFLGKRQGVPGNGVPPLIYSFLVCDFWPLVDM